MLYKKSGMPETDEIVVCTVTNVQYNSVFVNLDDYGKGALIHISEVSPGRIRNIRDFVKVGKVLVCKVLRVNPERGHIDVSLRRVNESQRRNTLEDRKNELKAEKILEAVADELKVDIKKAYADISTCIFKHYELLTHAFNDVVENDLDLSTLGIEDIYVEPLSKLIKERIKPKEVQIIGDLSLQIYASEGVTVVKEALIKADKTSEQLDVRSLGGGLWRLTVTAPEFKEAEAILKTAVDIAVKDITTAGGTCKFTRVD